MTCLAIALQTVFLIALFASDGYDRARTGEVARLVLTYASVVALFLFARVVFGHETKGRIAMGALWVIFVAINFARFETTGAFDYTFVHENVRELSTPFGRSLAVAQVRPWEIAVLLVIPVLLGWVVVWRAPTVELSGGLRLRVAAASATFFVAIPMLGQRTHESLTMFAMSAFRHHADSKRMEAAIAGEAYPFVRDFVPSARAAELAGTSTRPHVILLFLESWSALYSNRADASGRPYTPVLDAFRRDAFTFDSFYASSVQSSHGRFATLCSLVPLYRGKEANVLADAPLHCLPDVLKDAGYQTFLASGSDEPLFERSEEQFKKIGFDDVRFEDPAQRGHDPRVWGVGLQDDAFYTKFFGTLDAKIADDASKPLFAVAINVSHHYPFDKNPSHVPADDRPTKYGRNYVASLRTADAWLTTFFAELDRRPALRDAIVVLVGDHSFPADEHGVHFNGLGAREEAFRTAFALRWRGHVPSENVTDRVASQIDIAPTITDLLQLRHRTHFVGRSLVSGEKEQVAVPMVQPYDGVRLVAVHNKMKLEAHEAAGQQHLYDLAKDPDEEHDLFGQAPLDDEARRLARTIEDIRKSQAVLRAGRVWLPDQRSTSVR